MFFYLSGGLSCDVKNKTFTHSFVGLGRRSVLGEVLVDLGEGDSEDAERSGGGEGGDEVLLHGDSNLCKGRVLI
jgi:hypothetical protein